MPTAALQTLVTLLQVTLRRFAALRVYRMGAAMSFYLLFSAAPLLIAVTGIASLMFDPDRVSGEVYRQLTILIGPSFADAVASLVARHERPAGAVPVVVLGVLAAFWGASRVFVELLSALNVIWGVAPPDGVRAGVLGILRRRALSFALVVVAGLALTLGLLVQPVVATFGAALDRLLPDVVHTARALDATFSFGVTVGLLAAMYRFLPNADVRWRDVWPGAVLGAALLGLGALGFRVFLHAARSSALLATAASPLVVLSLVQYAVAAVYSGAILSHANAERRTVRAGGGEPPPEATPQATAASSSASRSGDNPAPSG